MFEDTTSLQSRLSVTLATLREYPPRESESNKDTGERREEMESQD